MIKGTLNPSPIGLPAEIEYHACSVISPVTGTFDFPSVWLAGGVGVQ
jgi:hypothetical protein